MATFSAVCFFVSANSAPFAGLEEKPLVPIHGELYLKTTSEQVRLDVRGPGDQTLTSYSYLRDCALGNGWYRVELLNCPFIPTSVTVTELTPGESVELPV